METISLNFRFNDPDLAEAVAASTPPKGVDVSKSGGFVEACEPAQILFHVAIEFGVGVSSIVVGSWLYDCLKKSGKKSTRINRKEIAIEERRIIRLIEEEITIVNERYKETVK
jgi:hypothetical protein